MMKDALTNFLHTDLKKQFAQDITRSLEEELEKPVKKRDYNKIQELTQAYTEVMGREEQIEASAQRWISEITKHEHPRIRLTRKMRTAFTAVSIAAVMLLSNIITVSAFDMNVFSFVVNLADGSFSIDFFSEEVPDDKIIPLPTSLDDPYGIIAECAKYGIYPETPHYLPENFVLTMYTYDDMPSYLKNIIFIFTNQHNSKQHITFGYGLFEDEKSIATVNFQNDEHNIKEIEINGNPTVFAEEKKDKQFQVVYHIDTLLLIMLTQDMSREEVNQIINSIY